MAKVPNAEEKLGTKRRRKIAENFNRLGRAHQRYRIQADDRQTQRR